MEELLLNADGILDCETGKLFLVLCLSGVEGKGRRGQEGLQREGVFEGKIEFAISDAWKDSPSSSGGELVRLVRCRALRQSLGTMNASKVHISADCSFLLSSASKKKQGWLPARR